MLACAARSFPTPVIQTRFWRRLGLVERAQDWRRRSLWAREQGPPQLRAALGQWPVERPRGWARHINRPLTEKELERLRASAQRGRPFADEHWVARTLRRLRLEHTARPEGRPRKRRATDAAAGN